MSGVVPMMSPSTISRAGFSCSSVRVRTCVVASRANVGIAMARSAKVSVPRTCPRLLLLLLLHLRKADRGLVHVLAAALDHAVDLDGQQDRADLLVGVHDVQLAWVQEAGARAREVVRRC